MTTRRRFPAPWQVEEMPGGYKVVDAEGRALSYVYGDDAAGSKTNPDVLTRDEALRIAWGIARLPDLLRPAAS